jgi:hypothetical protein
MTGSLTKALAISRIVHLKQTDDGDTENQINCQGKKNKAPVT